MALYVRRICAFLFIVLAWPALAAPPEPSPGRVADWWKHVEIIASDANEGRAAGSPGYDRAADYVVSLLKSHGLKPAGTNGYFQPVELMEQRFDQKASSAVLKRASGDVTLSVPQDLYYRGSTPMPASLDAPLVFAGYGLSIPEAGHDDFAGLDVKGKIVVVLSGGPADISGALKSDARSNRSKLLAARGALGVIALSTVKQPRSDGSVRSASPTSRPCISPTLRCATRPCRSSRRRSRRKRPRPCSPARATASPS